MRVIREIEVGGLKIQVKELTVGEIRAWLKDSGMVSGDLVDAALFEEFSLPDLLRMTDLTTESIAGLAPGDLRQVFAVAEEVNRDFSRCGAGRWRSGGRLCQGIETSALALAASGHAAVWNYPWAVFSLACELSSGK